MSSAADLVLMARVAGSLIVVLVLVALAARMARRAKFGRSATGIRVLERTGLTRDASVAVVEIGDRALVLGVTPHGVSLLTVLDGERLGVDEPEDAPARRGRSRRGRRAEVAPPVSRGAAAPSAADAFAQALADAGVDPAPGGGPGGGPGAGHGGGAAPLGFPAEGIPLAGGERLSAEDFGRIVEEAGQRLFGSPRATERDAGVLPSGVRLDQFPDLASALRAAGRVQQPAATPRPGVPRQPGAQPGARTGARTGAQAGAQARKAAPAQASDRPTDRGSDRREASGSVLDPATWRQGLEALRDLTARKG